MDNFISARYGEVLAGADAAHAKASMRSDLVEEDMHTSNALGADWDDEVYYRNMSDKHYSYNEYNADIERARGIADAEYASVDRFAETQARCANGYLT
ncbi:hypothetical protein [Actinophytocola algeriensis]|uniref:Uncharacterized protein n=1 Tax=Actinophytocola algeriensis TaxID=1768010 RepID=A0A7W7Q4A2_9PSEU|nr:hypothetical protein [Actinophytocola algeriensis]MBB4906424.1 hypothetical protein [Actinophytocola algeriensis]MBE1477905.1 hypothetical protein [Actinophytocola algeriensis]